MPDSAYPKSFTALSQITNSQDEAYLKRSARSVALKNSSRQTLQPMKKDNENGLDHIDFKQFDMSFKFDIASIINNNNILSKAQSEPDFLFVNKNNSNEHDNQNETKTFKEQESVKLNTAKLTLWLV
jgi:hypothetical protein